MMDLNYHHLRYFHCVAQEGSIAAAAKRLLMAKATISSQLKTLEAQVGAPLFQRRGKKLELTHLGQHIFQYAEEIFRLGSELELSLRSGVSRQPLPLNIGITNAVPKIIAYQLMAPVLAMENQPDITVIEDETDNLLAKMAIHRLDLVIADTPLPPHISLNAEEKLLGSSPIAIYASDPIAQDLQGNFPASLSGAPFLAPTQSSALGREVSSWLAQREIQPNIVGRFENSSLLKYFATNGHGCFAAPLSLSEYLATSHYVLPIGELTGVTVSFYALHNRRRLRHSGIETIIATGQRILNSE